MRDQDSRNYGLRLTIADIVTANRGQIEKWKDQLRSYVISAMSDGNVSPRKDLISEAQERAWLDSFCFMAKHLAPLGEHNDTFELIFEYSMPGTSHERPDVILLTNGKVLSLEFKMKDTPQIDDNKDDVAQAKRYKEWIEHHHEVTKTRNLKVESYLICTSNGADAGNYRGIEVLNKDNFCAVLEAELALEMPCAFVDEWLNSPKTEMPDMLRAIEIMYKEGRIPYIADVNRRCLDTVLDHIRSAKDEGKRKLILINGVPGAGKTAVGQCVVFEQNKGGEANAVYLSGNGPLVEVLQYQIDQAGGEYGLGQNAIQAMMNFKTEYFPGYKGREKAEAPEQSVLVFDEAQRAWDKEKMPKGYSEPEGLFRVGDQIFRRDGYAVLIGLFGTGQAIYNGEEAGISLWNDALVRHSEWDVVVAESLAEQLEAVAATRKHIENDVFLPVSIRADFVDCSKWVDKVLDADSDGIMQAKIEMQNLQKTPLQIYLTRSPKAIEKHLQEIDADQLGWKHGWIASGYASSKRLNKKNTVQSKSYGQWFAGECNTGKKVCQVYGIQGLELDVPIVFFGGDYVRLNGKWVAGGEKYEEEKEDYENLSQIIGNQYRVLLTRARKEMILYISQDWPFLDETYEFFKDMEMDTLE